MAKPGRKPRNPVLKVIDGNPGRRPVPEQPKLPPLDAEPPAYLIPAAVEKWMRWASSLIGKGLFADVHKELLASTVQAWALYEEYSMFVAKHGLKDDAGRRRPEAIAVKEQWEIARKGMSDLGISPSELGRMTKPQLTDGYDF